MKIAGRRLIFGHWDGGDSNLNSFNLCTILFAIMNERLFLGKAFIVDGPPNGHGRPLLMPPLSNDFLGFPSRLTCLHASYVPKTGSIFQSPYFIHQSSLYRCPPGSYSTQIFSTWHLIRWMIAPSLTLSLDDTLLFDTMVYAPSHVASSPSTRFLLSFPFGVYL